MAKKRSKKSKEVTVDVKSVKQSIQSRVKTGVLVKNGVATSPVAQQHPDLLSSGGEVGQAGEQLGAALVQADLADAAAAKAHDDVAKLLLGFDGVFALFTALVQRYCADGDEVRTCGVQEQVRKSHPLATPDHVTAVYDPVKRVIDVTVPRVDGISVYGIEVSDNPSDPTSWKLIEGYGSERQVPALQPGNYWFRACSLRAKARSEFTEPALVVVR